MVSLYSVLVIDPGKSGLASLSDLTETYGASQLASHSFPFNPPTFDAYSAFE